jgi:hypothetical protein
VYISIDRGISWSYLGNNMPGAAIADLEIHESTMDLVAATHGRGIYKINLLPVHSLVNKKFSIEKDHLFEIAESYLPWFQAASRTPDYRTIEKTNITWWQQQPKQIKLSLRDTANKEIWSFSLKGQQGFNQYRWDLIVSKATSDLPYFTQYEKWINPGTYNLILSDGKSELSQPLIVIKNKTPYKK